MNFLAEFGSKQSKAFVYELNETNKKLIVGLYVDDGLKCAKFLDFFLLKLIKELKITYGNDDTQQSLHIEMRNDEYLFQFAWNYSY